MNLTITKASGATITVHDVYSVVTGNGFLLLSVPPYDHFRHADRRMTINTFDEACEITDTQIKYTGPVALLG